MTHDIKYRQMEIPELDAFLEEYAVLCEKHGIQLVSEEYGYDGGSYMTIEPYSDGSVYLNLDQAGHRIPFLERVRKEAERLNQEQYVAERKARAEAQEAQRVAEERRALEDGIVLGGKKYRLTPVPK